MPIVQYQKPSVKKAVFGALAVGFILSIIVGLTPTTKIVISINNEREPTPIVADGLPCVWRDDDFGIQWRHSVEKRLWQEFYRIDDDKFVLTHTFLETFGAGTPDRDPIINAPKGFFGMKNGRTLTELNWIVSRRMQGTIYRTKLSEYGKILDKNQEFKIFEQVPDYTVINIKPVKKSALAWQFMEKCNVHR